MVGGKLNGVTLTVHLHEPILLQSILAMGSLLESSHLLERDCRLRLVRCRVVVVVGGGVLGTLGSRRTSGSVHMPLVLGRMYAFSTSKGKCDNQAAYLLNAAEHLLLLLTLLFE